MSTRSKRGVKKRLRAESDDATRSAGETITQSSRRRAQSEPLAALIAVTVVCAALSLYAGTVTSVLPTLGSDRAVAEPAADSIWQDISDGSAYTAQTNIPEVVDSATLPAGYYVSVEVAIVDADGSLTRVGRATFDGAGDITNSNPPDNAERIERPVAVQVQPGDVRPGKFIVEVWE